MGHGVFKNAATRNALLVLYHAIAEHLVIPVELNSDKGSQFFANKRNKKGETDTSDNTKSTFINLKIAQPKMHVESIMMSLVGFFFKRTRATVTVFDENSRPVQYSTMYGDWSGATTDKDVGFTNVNGKVTVTSNYLRRPPKGTTFTFCVDTVVKSGWIYDSSANKENCDSIKV